jgi:hypothetical protein
MRRVVLKHELPDTTNVIRTGPNPKVMHVGEAGWSLCVWVETDAPVADLTDPVFESAVLVFDVVETGQVDGVVIRPYHRHVGSSIKHLGVRSLDRHVYLVTGAAFDLEELDRRRREAMWVLQRTEPGEVVRAEVRRRDGKHCRLCGGQVSWTVPISTTRSPSRATYVLLDLWDPVSVDNVVLACEPCSHSKGLRSIADAGMVLRDAASGRPSPPAVVHAGSVS